MHEPLVLYMMHEDLRVITVQITAHNCAENVWAIKVCACINVQLSHQSDICHWTSVVSFHYIPLFMVASMDFQE